jgi:hypothetical protein
MNAGSDRRERGAVSPSLIIVLVLLVVGVVVAVLGVRSAVVAVQDRQELADYSDARAKASRKVENGNQAVAAGQQLCNCDIQARDLARQGADALAARDIDRFNGIVEQLNGLADQSNQLLEQLRGLP